MKGKPMQCTNILRKLEKTELIQSKIPIQEKISKQGKNDN